MAVITSNAIGSARQRERQAPGRALVWLQRCSHVLFMLASAGDPPMEFTGGRAGRLHERLEVGVRLSRACFIPAMTLASCQPSQPRADILGARTTRRVVALRARAGGKVRPQIVNYVRVEQP